MKNKFLLIHLLLTTCSMIASENESHIRLISPGFQYTKNTFLTKKTIQYDKEKIYRIDAKKTNNTFELQRMHEISSVDINHRIIKTRPTVLAYTLLIGAGLTGYFYQKYQNSKKN